MKKQIGRLARAARKAITYPIKLTVSTIYSPRQILNEGCDSYTEISQARIGESSYLLANIQNGRIFTNRIDNISVISQKSLIPSVSWQYSNGKVLPDSANALLNKKILIHRPPQKINGTVISLLTGGGGNYNYYHWLFDCLPRLRIAETINNLDEHTYYFIPEDTHPFQYETLEALGIPATSCISSKECQHLQSTHLIVTSHPNPDPSKIPEWIVNFLRESFLNIASARSKERFVYISRGDSLNSRRLLNEEYLCKLLESVGFGIYQLSELTVSDQVSLFSQARMIVGVHGAGLANLVFASKGAVVYELFSDQYQPAMYKRISSLSGLDYHRIVCEANKVQGSSQRTNFSILEESALTILKHAEQITANNN
jgi:hypothetical protein